MARSLLALLLIFFLQSCSKGLFNGDIEKNLEEMDKVHGYCNNPYRNFSKAQKKICEDKERAAGAGGKVPDALNITKMIEDIRSGGGTTVVQGLSVNQNLWDASLVLLDQYPLDIVDAQGGFISTNWIIEKNNPNQRCLIKINVTSKELVSSGVRVKLLCEKKDTDDWYSDGVTYYDDEKSLTLKILEIANEISVTEKLS